MTLNELPDDIRVPLDELHADADYLFARVAQGSLTVDQGALAMRRKLDAAKTAIVEAPQVRCLNRDDARLALWTAMREVPTLDDKLLVERLAAAGVYLAASVSE